MGQRRQEEDDRDITDNSNADADPRPENDDAKKLLQKIKLSGNFRNYREMKLKQLQGQTSNSTTNQSTDDGQSSEGENWNHFTTPLKPLSSTPSSNSASSQASSQANSTIEEEPKQKSVFSDLERTQTIDRFGHTILPTQPNNERQQQHKQQLSIQKTMQLKDA
eukprot:scaffold13403_cov91-Skeletonema_marinoi.AAC.2